MNAKLNINDTLQEITKLGIKLSMDDFGSGYSSLSYLRQYPFNVLKIDRMFINGITSKKEDCNLVKATIAMSHSLGLTVVAEGVETKEQLVLLGELNCDFVQGYYFSKPLPEELLLDFSPRFLYFLPLPHKQGELRSGTLSNTCGVDLTSLLDSLCGR